MTTINRTKRPDLTYTVDGTKWTLRADFSAIEGAEAEHPGVMHYVMRRDSAGRQIQPTPDEADAYVYAALPEKQRAKYAKARSDGSFPDYLVADAAYTAWRNTVGMTQIEAANERVLTLVQERLRKLESAESQEEFLSALRNEPEEPAADPTVD